MTDPFAPIACNWYPHLLPNPAIATVQRGRLTHDRLIQHQDHRVPALTEPPFEPPLAWCQVAERRAR
jgi:hypothetical protein